MTDAKTKGDAIAAMKALAERFRQNIEQSDDYRAMKALEDAIAKMSEPSPNVSTTTFAVGTSGPRPPRTTQSEAAYIAIRTEGKPLSIAELLQQLEAVGVKVGGTNPKVNLSSTLSRDERFVPVYWGGAPRWWLQEEYPPPEP